jgi:hypothetical protein
VLATPLRVEMDDMDIVGLKAIVKYSGYAILRNGKPYNNKCVSDLVLFRFVAL